MDNNLPPGVSEGMIPGNRPEDADLEAVQESTLDSLVKHRLHLEEYRIVAKVGVEAVMEARRYAKYRADEARSDERERKDRVVENLLNALRILHPKKDVWRTPNDEEGQIIQDAIDGAF